MLESLNYSFRNPPKHNLSNLPHQTVEKLQKKHGVLRGPQLGKQRWRARLGILRVNLNLPIFTISNRIYCRSQWPRGLRRRSTVARLLRSWVRIPPRAWMFVVSVVCCQVEVSATDWSLVQRSPTDCGASLCVIKKPRKRGCYSLARGL